MVNPLVGIHLTVVFTLLDDKVTVVWFPFTEDFSSRESLLFISHQIKFSCHRINARHRADTAVLLSRRQLAVRVMATAGLLLNVARILPGTARTCANSQHQRRHSSRPTPLPNRGPLRTRARR